MDQPPTAATALAPEHAQPAGLVASGRRVLEIEAGRAVGTQRVARGWIGDNPEMLNAKGENRPQSESHAAAAQAQPASRDRPSRAAPYPASAAK